MSRSFMEKGGDTLDDDLRRLLDRAVAASANGIVITDSALPDDPIIYVNPAFEQTTGYTADEAVGRNCRFLQGEDREQPGLTDLRAAIREGRECRVVLRNYRKDGGLFWNELYVSPVYGEDGTVTNFVGVQNDVTDRRRIEEVLRKSEDRLRIAVESTGLGTWDFYPESGELRWDERCKAMFGLSPSARVDYEVFLSGVHPDDRDRTDATVRRALDPDGGGSYSAEFRTIGLENGVQRWVAARGQAFFEGERPVRFIGTVLDITERKRAEEERDLLLVREQLARAEAVATRRRLGLLAAVGPVLASSLDYAATLTRIPYLVVPDFADMCVLDIVRGDVVEQIGTAHADPEKEVLLHRMKLYRNFGEKSPGYVARVLHTGQAVLLPRVDEAAVEASAINDEHRRLLLDLDIHSIISVPLLARGRVLGAMSLASSRGGRTFTDEDLALAEGLAYRCALSVDNARIHEEQTYISRTIQRSLLPDLPSVPGVEVGVEYLPVGEESEIGGDFYDLMRGPEGADSWLVILGDVRGKGAVAASITALARYSIRALALREDDPAALLTAVNAVMLRQLTDYQYCTVACVRLRPLGAGVEATVTRGGHPPPLILRASGTVEEVGPVGRALGIFPDAELCEETTHLGIGDTLLLYTDGVTEARSAEGVFYGEDRLRSLFASCSGQTAQEITECIKASVLEFQDGSPRDDLALMVLRVVR